MTNRDPMQLEGGPANGSAETTKDAPLIDSLSQECERLRVALAKAEEERDRYRKALYEIERGKRTFEDLDIEELKRLPSDPFAAIQ
ncbi:MAG: hypothetical protein L0219_11780 [Phycisphaerales bacterium]|nr:hypothetical protein [Phycisphaerales bacterium]